jgi:hypothetical protein
MKLKVQRLSGPRSNVTNMEGVEGGRRRKRSGRIGRRIEQREKR